MGAYGSPETHPKIREENSPGACTVCYESLDPAFNYCPKCGAPVAGRRRKKEKTPFFIIKWALAILAVIVLLCIAALVVLGTIHSALVNF